MHRRLLAALPAALVLATSPAAHDAWISRDGLKNAAGEYCCGEGDCFVIPSQFVRLRRDGYHLVLAKSGLPLDPRSPFKPVAPRLPFSRAPAADPGMRVETVPFAEAQPSPDGQFWRCKKPDGSRRCFFAPPPNT